MQGGLNNNLKKMNKRQVNKKLEVNNKERNWQEIVDYFWYKFLKKAIKKSNRDKNYRKELKMLIFFNV